MWSNVILIEIINPSLLKTNTCNQVMITKSEDEKVLRVFFRFRSLVSIVTIKIHSEEYS